MIRLEEQGEFGDQDEDVDGYRIQVENHKQDSNIELDPETDNEVSSEESTLIEEQVATQESTIPTLSINEIGIELLGQLEPMEVDNPIQDFHSKPDRRKGCGHCTECNLYLDYLSGARTKENAGVQRKLRFKCGQCKRCKQKKMCKNITCSNIKSRQ